MRTLLLALAITLAAMAATAGQPSLHDDELPPVVAAALAQAGLPHAAFAAVALPLSTRWARPWQHRAQQPVQPGSTMKLVTSVVALDRLGPNHRGRTELLVTGTIEGDRLTGDLVLKGGADPDLDLPALWQMLWELRRRGVREIGGGLLLDRTLFRPARIDVGLPPFDEFPEFPYNGIPDALMLADNLMGVALSSDHARMQARQLLPLDGIEIEPRLMTLTDAPCADWGDGWLPALVEQDRDALGTHYRIGLRGSFPRNCEVQAELQLVDRNAITERQVRAVWASLGGSWPLPPGQVREDPTPSGAIAIASHQSRPWGEVLRSMNKRSDNPQARLLFLQLGQAAMAREPNTPTLDLARREVERWFDERRIDRNGLVLDNGSGLSRSERIAPQTLALLLKAAWSGPHAPELLMSLPVAGVDGSLRQRLKGTPAEGWSRLKTGTLKDVVALAGYVRDTRGDTWAVVGVINHPQAALGRPALDALVEWVAGSGARWR